ncbi:hypothetical protein G7068_09120 [Leucobacter viscericola]|uniref:Uncharacterized protein n=1 Tax=Leucobacter viscericola TaxID=2714935 RepID=A0A6G7XFQ7_9MICO|nr:hypothetical protein [Leucobacter viscericola]QIK63342.1 hypothetical protein G7068_09120 [Leucobacter viscericola]
MSLLAASLVVLAPTAATAAPLPESDTYVRDAVLNPTLITTSSAPMELTYTYGASDQKSSVVSFDIASPLVYSEASIKLEAANMKPGTLQITLEGRAFNTDTDGDTWDGSVYHVSYETIAEAGAHEYPSTLYFETSRFRHDSRLSDLPVKIMNDGELTDTKLVNVKEPSTAPTVINTSVDNGKYDSTRAEYDAATSAETRLDTSFNKKMGIGTIDLTNPELNIVRTSINGAVMSDHDGPTGVNFDATLPALNTVYNSATPTGGMADTPSGLIFAAQKLDLTQPGFPNIPGVNVVSAQFTEVGGAYGDPLGDHEVRISKDPATQRTHIEYHVNSLPRDEKLFLVYYQNVETIPTPTGDYPEFVGNAAVTWDQQTADAPNKIGTWQTPYAIAAAAVNTVKSVDKTAIHPGDSLSYTFDINATKDSASFWIADNVDARVPLQADTATSTNSKCVPSVDAAENLLRVDCDALAVGESAKITVGVDTTGTHDGDKIDNTYYLGTDLGYLKGNDVSTVVTESVTPPPVDPTDPTVDPSNGPQPTDPTNGTTSDNANQPEAALATTGADLLPLGIAAATALLLGGGLLLFRRLTVTHKQ